MNIFTDEDIKEIVGPWGDTPIKGYTRSLFDKIEAKLREKQAEPQPEPVAWRFKPMIGLPWSLSDDGYYISCKRDQRYIVEPLYTTPPQRQPLTKEEIDDCWLQSGGLALDFARALEHAHNIGGDK